MANLFFIHTPLQLMIAQQIISQEKLSNNVMLLGYVGDNSHFIQIYEMIIVEELWVSKVPMPTVSHWAVISWKHMAYDCWKAYKYYKFIRNIVGEYRISTLFLGDMWNSSCQLAALNFHRKGYKICFFEEGNGHYTPPTGYGIGGNLLSKVYAILIDIFYYLPMYGVRMGYLSYWKGITLNDIPMDARYSVVPFYHEKFDILLTVTPLISNRLAEYISNEILQIGKKSSILLLTSPIYEWMGDCYEKDEAAYVKTIIDFVKSVDEGICIHIKFHPREKEHVREKLLTEFSKVNIDYIILGSEMNIPVEFYLQQIHYEKIVMLLSSTSIYNGYLFPKVKFVSILKDYYKNCKTVGSKSLYLLEPLLKEIPKE